MLTISPLTKSEIFADFPSFTIALCNGSFGSNLTSKFGLPRNSTHFGSPLFHIFSVSCPLSRINCNMTPSEIYCLKLIKIDILAMGHIWFCTQKLHHCKRTFLKECRCLVPSFAKKALYFCS